jgi:alanine dehydrogenase
VREVIRHGHSVCVEVNAGQGIGATDEDYKQAGAQIIPTAAEIFAKADMIVKVKEPQAAERYLPASGTRSGADQGSRQVGRHLHRL